MENKLVLCIGGIDIIRILRPIQRWLESSSSLWLTVLLFFVLHIHHVRTRNNGKTPNGMRRL